MMYRIDEDEFPELTPLIPNNDWWTRVLDGVIVLLVVFVVVFAWALMLIGAYEVFWR